MRYEIRFHGRGGQGVVTAAEILAYAAILSGYYAQAFPEFGAERRGAPVRAYFRLDDREPIYERSPVESPDIVVILDEGLLTRLSPPPYSDLKNSGWLVINTSLRPESIREIVGRSDIKIATIDATTISMDILKRPIVNTTIVGALARVFPVIPIENIEKAIRGKFSADIAELNIRAVKRGYEETQVVL